MPASPWWHIFHQKSQMRKLSILVQMLIHWVVILDVKKYLKNQLNQIHVYPDSESTRLRSNLKWFTGINTSQILIGNGATEIIYNFCSTFVNKKSKVLIPCPTFSEYEKAVNFFGGKTILFQNL